jgi:hypothetical protein
LGFEILMGSQGIPRNAEDNGIKAPELIGEISEILPLSGTTWGVILRIKIKDYVLALQLR